jgi:tripartite-type tricarboxylate transporter receptor subunit TctC
MVLTASVASGQGYPSRPIRVVTVGYGSNTDVATRLIADAVAGSLGQRMVVENRAVVAPEIVAAAPPDGYTLLHYSNVLWVMPLFREGVRWDPVKDFLPITETLTSPNLLVVHPSMPVRTTRELISFAKARPGQLNYGSSSTGSGNHVAAELFKSMAGVDIVRVNYKSGGQAVNDLLAGQVHLMFPAAGSVMPHVKSGKARALAVTSARPSPLVPGLPTLAASGLPTYESSSIAGLFAPAGTPAAIINRLNQEVVKALQRPEVKERLFKAGIEAVGGSPAEFASKIKSEMTRLEKVIKDAGLREKG